MQVYIQQTSGLDDKQYFSTYPDMKSAANVFVRMLHHVDRMTDIPARYVIRRTDGAPVLTLDVVKTGKFTLTAQADSRFNGGRSGSATSYRMALTILCEQLPPHERFAWLSLWERLTYQIDADVALKANLNT